MKILLKPIFVLFCLALMCDYAKSMLDETKRQKAARQEAEKGQKKTTEKTEGDAPSMSPRTPSGKTLPVASVEQAAKPEVAPKAASVEKTEEEKIREKAEAEVDKRVADLTELSKRLSRRLRAVEEGEESEEYKAAKKELDDAQEKLANIKKPAEREKLIKSRMSEELAKLGKVIPSAVPAKRISLQFGSGLGAPSGAEARTSLLEQIRARRTDKEEEVAPEFKAFKLTSEQKTTPEKEPEKEVVAAKEAPAEGAQAKKPEEEPVAAKEPEKEVETKVAEVPKEQVKEKAPEGGEVEKVQEKKPGEEPAVAKKPAPAVEEQVKKPAEEPVATKKAPVKKAKTAAVTTVKQPKPVEVKKEKPVTPKIVETEDVAKKRVQEIMQDRGVSEKKAKEAYEAEKRVGKSKEDLRKLISDGTVSVEKKLQSIRQLNAFIVEEQKLVQKDIQRVKTAQDVARLGQRILDLRKEESQTRLDQSKILIDRENAVTESRDKAADNVQKIKGKLLRLVNETDKEKVKTETARLTGELNDADKKLKAAEKAVQASDKQIKLRVQELKKTLAKYEAVKGNDQDSAEITKLKAQIASLEVVEKLRVQEQQLKKIGAGIATAKDADSKKIMEGLKINFEKSIVEAKNQKNLLLTAVFEETPPKVPARPKANQEVIDKKLRENVANADPNVQKASATTKLQALSSALTTNRAAQKEYLKLLRETLGGKDTLTVGGSGKLEEAVNLAKQLQEQQKTEVDLVTEQSRALIQKEKADASLLQDKAKIARETQKTLAVARKGAIPGAVAAKKQADEEQKTQARELQASGKEAKRQIDELSKIIKAKANKSPTDPAIAKLQQQVDSLEAVAKVRMQENVVLNLERKKAKLKAPKEGAKQDVKDKYDASVKLIDAQLAGERNKLAGLNAQRDAILD